MPDFDQVVTNRETRSQRHSRPYVNLREAADQCIAAGRDLLKNNNREHHRELLERSVVITFVTHVEVYFRDILDAIFKQCDPEYFLPKLKHIHQAKYDINDLIDMHVKEIHPLELVSSDASFQNAEKIEKVFSKFLGGSLWGEAIGLQIRNKKVTEHVVTFEPEYLEGLKRVFSLRHELVHNPKNNFRLTEDILRDITNGDGLLFAVDIVLCKMLVDNRDPTLADSLS